MKWLDTARAYLKQDPAAHTIFEVIILYPGYHALFFYRIAHFFYTLKLFFIARFISQVGRFFTQIEIHPGAQIGQRFVIDHGSGVVIGETAIVGDDCFVYHGVTLGAKRIEKDQRHPRLGNHVIVGSHAQILGNITVGDHSVIGAGSIVTKDVPARVVVAGNPAKIIKKVLTD